VAVSCFCGFVLCASGDLSVSTHSHDHGSTIQMERWDHEMVFLSCFMTHATFDARVHNVVCLCFVVAAAH
jgi:hypothetical protein